MYSAVVEIPRNSISGTNHVDLIIPSYHDCVVTTPLQILWRDPGFGVMLAQAVLEVGGDDMSPAICGIEGSELAVGRNADVCERPYVKEPVFALGRIDHVDRLADA